MISPVFPRESLTLHLAVCAIFEIRKVPVIMLKVSGNKIFEKANREVLFRGFNLGTWMLLECSMLGTPGTETRLRQAMDEFAGKEKAEYFWGKFYENFIGEADIQFLSGIGCNSVRIPFNYHHFESDDAPYQYREEGFRILDRVIELCGKYNIYVILDMHAVPGGQNTDWHGDNYSHDARLFSDALCRDRFTKLWIHIAGHYKGNETVAGYEIMNEPVAVKPFQLAALNKLYRNVTAEIRKVDKDHIIFLEGNLWGKTFEGFEEPFDDNLVYSPHYYAELGTCEGEYPVPGNDRRLLESEMDERDRFIRKYNVPCWIGEFGIREYQPFEARMRVLEDQLSVFNGRGYSWSYWTYKDIFLRSIVYFDVNSPWSKFVAEMRTVKDRYHSDMAVKLSNPWDLSGLFKDGRPDDFTMPVQDVKKLVERNIRETFSDLLTNTFAKRFAALTYEEA